MINECPKCGSDKCEYKPVHGVIISKFGAAGLGIEPKFSLSESDVLPLDDPAMY